MKKLLKKNLKIVGKTARKIKRAILTLQRRVVQKNKKIVRIFKTFQTNNFVGEIRIGFKKFFAIALIAGLFLQVGGVFIPSTQAYFNDTEISPQNSFSAGSLDINLSPAGIYSSGLMYPTDATSTTFTLSKIGNLDYQYLAKIELLGSNKLSCDYITVTATSTTGVSTGTFSSLIKDFVMPTSTPSMDVNWEYNFRVATDTPPTVWGKTCFFKWVYTGWQSDLTSPAEGFSDTEEKSGSIKIGKAVVLNEFIPNPTGLDTALMPGGEWVELYNNSSIPFDLSSWVLYDEMDTNELYITASNTDTATTTISPHNWLVVYRNGDSDFNLNNDTDSLRLFTGYPTVSSMLVDSYTYTEEKPEGFSYARIPDGIGSWVDPIPTPGKPNTITDVDGMNQDHYVGVPDPGAVVVQEEIVVTSTPESIVSSDSNIQMDSSAVLSEQILSNSTITVPIISTTTIEDLGKPNLDINTVVAPSVPNELPSTPSNDTKNQEVIKVAILPTSEQVPAVELEVQKNPDSNPQGNSNISENLTVAVKPESNAPELESQNIIPQSTEPPVPVLPEPSTGGSNE